jgi:solute carrier family 45 protein 1/2/4
MIGGTVICMLAMLLLGFTRPIAAIFTGYDNTSVLLSPFLTVPLLITSAE